MSVFQLIVAAAGIVLGGFAVWAFLVRQAPLVRSGGRSQDVRIVLRRTFEPDVILIEPGRQVRLHVFREDASPATERIVIEKVKIERELAPFQTTIVEFTPPEPGDYIIRSGPIIGRVAAQVGFEAARSNLGRGHDKHG